MAVNPDAIAANANVEAEVAKEVVKASYRNFHTAIVILGITAIAAVLGGIGCALLNKDPGAIIAVATAAVGGLAGLLSQPGKSQG